MRLEGARSTRGLEEDDYIFDVTSESKVQGIDNNWFRYNRGLNIV